MGLLVDGVWQDRWYETLKGRFERQESRFRNWVTPDGRSGPTGTAASRRHPDAIIYSCRWPARGHIGR